MLTEYTAIALAKAAPLATSVSSSLQYFFSRLQPPATRLVHPIAGRGPSLDSAEARQYSIMIRV